MALHRWASGALTVWVVGTMASTMAGRAWACSLDPCPSSVRLAPQPYLPGNLVYFQIIGEGPPAIALRTAEGEPIAASIRTIGNDRVFAPEQPIAENTALVLEYSIECIGGFPETLPQTFEFITTAPGQIELIPARLVVEEVGVKHPGRDGETSFVRVRHFPGDANGNGSSLMIHTYTVDGLPVWRQTIDGFDTIEVPVPCRPQVSDTQRDTCGRLSEAAAGSHTVEVSTHVVGALTQPEPVSLEVDVQCPDTDAAEPSVDPEPQPQAPDMPMHDSPASTQATTAGPGDSMTYGADEGELLPAPAAAPVASSNGGGCALGSSGARAEGSGLLELIAAFMLSRGRRRSARSQ